MPILLTFSAFHLVPRNPKKNIQFQPKCRHFCRQKSAQIGCIIVSKLYIHFGFETLFCIASLCKRFLAVPYPEATEAEDLKLWLNRGSTYEKNVEKRDDIRVIKHGLRIPAGHDTYESFSLLMAESEDAFIKAFAK